MAPRCGSSSEFNSDGFVRIEKLISDEVVELLRHRLERVLRGEYDTGLPPDKAPKKPKSAATLGFSGNTQNVRTLQIINIWKADSAFRDVALSPSLGKRVAELAGWEGARLGQDQVWAKPPGAGNLTFHRDTPYFDFVPNDVVTVWLTLDDLTPDLGPLEYVRGSHCWGEQKHQGTAHAFFDDSPLDLVRAAALAEGISHAEFDELVVSMDGLSAGGCSIHDGRTWHGSGCNASANLPRRGLGLHFVPADAQWPAPSVEVGRLWKPFRTGTGLQLSDDFFPVTYRPSTHKRPAQEQQVRQEEGRQEEERQQEKAAAEEVEGEVEGEHEQVEGTVERVDLNFVSHDATSEVTVLQPSDTSDGAPSTLEVAAKLQLRCVEALTPLDMLDMYWGAADNTGHRIWLGARAFVEWLSCRRLGPGLAHRNVVELGCGAGLCGLALASLGAQSVTMTDIDPEVCDLARSNLRLNEPSCRSARCDDGSSDVEGGGEGATRGMHTVETLAWGDAGAAIDLLARLHDRRGVDLVVAADCIYNEDVIVPIMTTAATLMRGGGDGGEIRSAAESARFVLLYVPRCASPDREVRRQIEEAAEKAGLVGRWSNRAFQEEGQVGGVGTEDDEGLGWSSCWIDGEGGVAMNREAHGGHARDGREVRAELRDVDASVFVARSR